MSFQSLRRCALLGLLLGLGIGAVSAAEIRNIAVHQQADRMIISYDLEDDNPVVKAACADASTPHQCQESPGSSVVALLAINGRLYTHESLHLEGDIGRKVAPGKGRSFSWNVLRDFPQGIVSEILVSVTPSQKRFSERDVVSISDQQAEVFRRIGAEKINVAEFNRKIVFGQNASELDAVISETIQSSYALEPDEAQLEISRYYCARFSDSNLAKTELAALWNEYKRAPPPAIDDRTHEKFFRCLLRSLDPHSDYLTQEAYRELREGTKGTFGGLGIEITIKHGVPTVVSPMEDTPAFRAGILSHDRIIEIDAKPTTGLTISDVVKLMRGQEGTAVTLTVQREGLASPLRVALVRDSITMRSVRFRPLADDYGYIRVAQFQERTPDEFDAALVSLKAASGGNLKGLVLDLRNDPGGLLDAAISVASRFIDEGLIVTMHGRTESASQEFPALKVTKEPAYPIVVLINGGSASAAEIVAGALQDHRRALVVGARSFGKGSVQAVLPIAQGAIKLTTATYYTPNRKSIQQIGIVPDILLDQDAYLDEGNISFAQRMLSEISSTRALFARKDRVEQLKIEEFFALYRNAVRGSVAVASTSAPAGAVKSIWRPHSETKSGHPNAKRPDEQSAALVTGHG